MPVPTPDLRIGRDQNHLAWDPAILPVATVPSGSVVEFDCLDASFGQLTAESTTADIGTLDFARRPGQRAGGGGGRRAGWDAPDRAARLPARGLGLDGLDPRLRPAGRRVPGPVLQGHRPARRCGPGRVLARHPRPAGPVLRRGRGGARAGPLSTIPPDLHGGNMDTGTWWRARPSTCRCSWPGPTCRWATATPPRAMARCAGPPSRRRCGPRSGSPPATTCTSAARSSRPRPIRGPRSARDGATRPMASVRTS